MSTTASRSLSRPLAILLSFLLAFTGLTAFALPASAAPGDVTGGSAAWGIDATYRSQFESRSATGGASIAAGDMPTWAVNAASSSWNADTRTGVIQLTGAVRLGYMTGAPIPGVTDGNYVYLSNPVLTLNGDTGTLSASSAGASHSLSTDLPLAALATRDIATLNLAGVNPVEADGSLTWTAVPVSIAAGGAEVLASYASAETHEAPVKRAVGSALDPITFSISREAPLTTTTTTLGAAPAAGALVGEDVTLTATVSPAVAGTVEFRAGATTLGSGTVTEGVATLVTGSLALGAHELSAVFTPTSAGYAGSTSPSLSYEIITSAPTTGAAWGLSGYLNSANPGRPNPSAADYTAPATFDASARISTWGTPTSVSNPDGTVTLSFTGATLNHAKTGGSWLRLADLQATLDRNGNGVVSAVASYGTVPGTPGNIPFDADTAVTANGPERVNLVSLVDNAIAPVAVPGGATWSQMAGVWHADFLAFLAGGDGGAAWTYASTVTNSGAADRLPSKFSFSLVSVPTFVHYPTDAAWGISGYVNAANFGRPNPLPEEYGAPTTFDATSRMTTFTSGTVVSNSNRTVTVSYPGSSFNYAKTGGAWLRLADLQITVDESGNGVVSALASYGTVPGTPGNIPYDADTAVTVQSPTRVNLVTLAGNDADLVTVPAGSTFANLTGEWHPDFISFVGGDASATPPVAAWSYASNITNTGAADRKPSAFTLRFATAPVFSGTADGGDGGSGNPGTDPGTPTEATPAPGTLTWGVKSSFRTYILGANAKGSIATSGGAGSVGSSFWFPQSGSSLSADGLGAVSYRGGLFFSGHGGTLSMRIADPVVRLNSATSGVLSVVTANGRVDFATLNLGAAARTVAADGAVTYSAVPTTLTAAGAVGFAGFYSAGESLDSLSFTIGSNNATSGTATTRAAGANREPAPTPPATDGIQTPAASFSPGGTYTFTADGFQPFESGILVVIYSTPVVLADLTADANGRVTWTGNLPAGLSGTHTLTFQGSVDRGIVLDIEPAVTVGCPVEGVELSWGFKESFRAYLDSSIAHGEISVADGATYEEQLLGFTGAGGYDAETGDADLAFTGSVRFTGHGGVLDTTISNPRIVIDGDRAVLLLDLSGTTQDGSPVSASGIEFATLDLAAAERLGGGDLVAFSGIPAVLTEAGAAAFGTYEAGSALDPIALSIPVGADCSEGEAAPEAAATTLEAEPASDSSPILWIVLGILAAIAVIVAAVLLVRRARQA